MAQSTCAEGESLGSWMSLAVDMLGADIARKSGNFGEAEERLRRIERTYWTEWKKSDGDNLYKVLHEV